MGAAGVGGVGYALMRSTQPAGYDPRIKVELPEKPEGFVLRIVVLGRPIAVLGLTRKEAADARLAPGTPPFAVLDLVCVGPQKCVVGLSDPGFWGERWVCPCCGFRYSADGRALNPTSSLRLAAPEHRFVDKQSLLVGAPFQSL
jgi:Rieske Fe-S protein